MSFTSICNVHTLHMPCMLIISGGMYCIPGNFCVAKLSRKDNFVKNIFANDPHAQYKRVWHGDNFVKFNFATEQNSRKFSDAKISWYTVHFIESIIIIM